MAKQANGNRVYTGEEARQKILQGVNLIENAVGTTLGPRGKNVGINTGPEHKTYHDGVTIAKYVIDADPAVNFGAGIVRQAANKQVDQVGDGTTIVTILAASIIKEAYKATNTGVNEMELRPQLEDAASKVVEELKKMSKPIKTLEETIQVATISAEDPDLGKQIGEIIHKVGVDGVVSVEESKGLDTYIEHQEGMQWDKGYISQYHVTNPQRMEATIEDPLILLTDRTLHNVSELIPILEKLNAQNFKNLVVIAEDVVDTALSVLIGTKLAGKMNLLAVKAPQFGDLQKQYLQDIAVLTGGVVISKESGKKIEETEILDLGRARRITATKDATMIVDGQGKKEDIKERVESIKAEMERHEGSEFDLEKLRERVAKLSSGVVVVKVGGHTEVEMSERVERAKDAVLSTKAALEDGVVAGGEISYLSARQVLKQEVEKGNIAHKILFDALAKPFKRLVENAGGDPGEILAHLSYEKEPNMGYDVTDRKIKDMVKTGILDATKICTSAVNNAMSVAVALITTSVLIVPNIEEVPDEGK